jgi:methylthioribulose-1-phosphate dehydratase
MASSIEEPASKKRKADSLSAALQNGTDAGASESEALVLSPDPLHPANHICELCRSFYTFGWVTGTGGGVSIKDGEHIYIAPSGVQKELMRPKDMFVMKADTGEYLRRPAVGSAPPSH